MAWGQAVLPPCEGNEIARWHNCVGSADWPNGQRYVGEYRGGFPNGKGTLTSLSGEVYVGHFLNGERHGQGTWNHPNGQTYVGEHRHGKRHGQGVYTWPSGNKHVGEFRDGKSHGHGTHFFPDGARHVGENRDGKWNGEGILYGPNGNILGSGRWESNKNVQQFALDTNRFPFNSQPSVATNASATNSELDAERKKRQQLEADLEAEKRRRIAAETRGRVASQSNSSGTGFAVASGLLVTNQHVVAGCQKLEVLSRDGRRAARVLDADGLVDLALLRVTGLGGNTAAIRRSGSVRLGEAAYAFGFPLTGLLSEAGNFTSGVVSSLRGMRDSANHIQISTPVQPGNSGGALVDASGSVIGVVVGKLNASAVARATGDIPQNVNFAVSLQALSDFLNRNKVAVKTVERGAVIDTANLAEAMSSFTHRIECLDAPSVAEQPAPRGGTSAQGAANTAVTLWNRAPESIFKIYVSPQSSDKWGLDLLGSNVLPAGRSFNLQPPSIQGCIFDVRVEYKDGRFEQKERQDFCALTELVFTGSQSGQTAQQSATNWYLVSTGTSGNKFYVNPSTIKRDGVLRRYWELLDLAQPTRTGAMSLRAFKELDCVRERLRTLQLTSFIGSMATGQVHATDDEAGNWSQIAPDSNAEQVMKYVCAR